MITSPCLAREHDLRVVQMGQKPKRHGLSLRHREALQRWVGIVIKRMLRI